MSPKKKLTPWEKEWALLVKKENQWLAQNAQYKPSALNRLLEGKVPPKLQHTLEGAFLKAFGLIFDKGAPLLERTFSPEALQRQNQVDRYAAQVQRNRKALKTCAKRSGRAGTVNLMLSGAEGVVLGALGVGIPDIPLFTSLLLRSLYEMACHFGFPYDTPEERYFQLLLIHGALSFGGELEECDRALNEFAAHPVLPEPCDRNAELETTARALSRQLLYMKFLQGVPLVGVAGGAYDAVCLHRVQKFARLKYQRRLLLAQAGHLAPKPVE